MSGRRGCLFFRGRTCGARAQQQGCAYPFRCHRGNGGRREIRLFSAGSKLYLQAVWHGHRNHGIFCAGSGSGDRPANGEQNVFQRGTEKRQGLLQLRRRRHGNRKDTAPGSERKYTHSDCE